MLFSILLVVSRPFVGFARVFQEPENLCRLLVVCLTFGAVQAPIFAQRTPMLAAV
jgi:hypothetical protein